MNLSLRSVPTTRQVRLKLAAVLYVGARVLLLGVLVAVPLVYWRMGVPEGQVAVVAGGVVVVLGLVMAHWGARQVRCVVCSQPSLRYNLLPKHPYAGKWLGISHRGRVAWDVLTTSHHHCMYCHTRCRNQAQSSQDLVPETGCRQAEILRHFPGPMASPATEAPPAGSAFAETTIFDLGLLDPAANLPPPPAVAPLFPVFAAEMPQAPSLESWLPALPDPAEVSPVLGSPWAVPLALEPSGAALPAAASIPLPPIPASSAPLLSAAPAFPIPVPSMFPPAISQPSPPPFSKAPFPGGSPLLPAVPAAQGNPAAFPLPALPHAMHPLPHISAAALPAINPPAFPPGAAPAPSDSPWSAKPEQKTQVVPTPPGEAQALPPSPSATPASMEALIHILQQGRETMEAAFLSIIDQLRDAAGTMALPIDTSGQSTVKIPAPLAGLPVPALPLQTFPLQPLVLGSAALSPVAQGKPAPVLGVQLAELPIYPPLHPVMTSTPSLPPVLDPADLRGAAPAGEPPLARAAAPVRRRALSLIPPYLMAQLGPTLAQAFTQAPGAAHGMEPAASMDPVAPPSPAPGNGFPTPFLMPPVPPGLTFVPVPPNSGAVVFPAPTAQDESSPGVPLPGNFLPPATPSPPAWPTDALADLPQSEGLPMWTRSRGKPSLS